MSTETVTSVYICCWALRDPLCQGQTLAYLRQLTALGHRFALITFEHESFVFYGAEREAAKRELEAEGIHWYPLPNHPGSSLFGKMFDCASGVAISAYATLHHRTRIVHARSTIPAAVALVVAAVCRSKFIYDADCDLSRECLDVGRWKESDLPYKLTAACERLARERADATIVLTEHTRARVAADPRVAAPVTVIPCCVDVDRFRFDAEQRAVRRAELGVSDERLFVYVGKTGSWYLVDEMFALFRVARTRGPARLLVVSPDSPDRFHAIADRQGVPRASYEVRSATHPEVAGWLSAGDVGLGFIKSLESKLGCSPVKVGEYLAVGLPVLITEGIGDYSDIIRSERLGAVVTEQTDAAYQLAIAELEELWAEGDALRARCRRAADAHVSLQGVGRSRYLDVYGELLA